MTTLIAGSSATVTVPAFSTLTVNPSSATGTIVFTSAAESEFSGFTANVNNRIFGPFTVPMSALISVTSGTVDYSMSTSSTELLAQSSRNQQLGIDGRAPAMTVGCIGDSRINQGFDYAASFNGAAGDTSLSNYGYQFWWKFFSRAPLEFTNHAVAGATSADVVALQLDDALAGNYDIYMLLIGVNDTTLSGAQSLANVTLVYNAVKAAGKRLLLLTDPPSESYSTTKTRIAILNAGIRALAYSDPATVKVADLKSAVSNPASSDGAAYDSASAFDLTYDVTHQNTCGAIVGGRVIAVAAKEWTGMYVIGPNANGEAKNLLTNAAMGGTAGTKPTGGTGAVADSWIAARSGATVAASKYYKVRNVATVLEVGATPVVGMRCKVLGVRDFHYICITAGAAVVTLPSSTTLFDDTHQPDAVTGPIFLVLPANDKDKTNPWYGVPFEAQYIEMSDTTSANTSISMVSATVTTGFSVGDRIQASVEIEFLESAWQAFALRIVATTSGAAKTNDSHGPSYNIANTLLLEPNLAGMCCTSGNYTVPANTANLIHRLYLYNRTANIKTRVLVHHPVLVNLST